VTEHEETSVAIPVLWTGGEDLPVIMVNQFIVTVYEGEVFLSVGTLTPPAISGPTTEDVKRQVDTIGYVPVRTAVKPGSLPGASGN